MAILLDDTREHHTLNLYFNSSIPGGTGIRGLIRGMATIPQGNQELLVVKDKVGRPQVSLVISFAHPFVTGLMSQWQVYGM